jgi:signal recognition particle receptor subunit beta
MNVKIVICGPFASGKTEFIRAISEIDPVSTERKVTDSSSLIKGETTVAMDFGRITIDDDLILYLFGTPGQKRFDFMWDILSHNMIGYIILLDTTRPETFSETTDIIRFFSERSDVPFIVAASKSDHPQSIPLSTIEKNFHFNGTKVIGYSSHDKESVKNALLELLYLILERVDDE